MLGRLVVARGTIAAADGRWICTAPMERSRDEAIRSIEAWACRLPPAAYDRSLEIARQRLVAHAAAARARGVALHYATEIAGTDGRRWLARRFYGGPAGPAPLDEATTAILTQLGDRADNVGKVRLDPETGALPWSFMPRTCPDVSMPLALSEF